MTNIISQLRTRNYYTDITASNCFSASSVIDRLFDRYEPLKAVLFYFLLVAFYIPRFYLLASLLLYGFWNNAKSNGICYADFKICPRLLFIKSSNKIRLKSFSCYLLDIFKDKEFYFIAFNGGCSVQKIHSFINKLFTLYIALAEKFE